MFYYFFNANRQGGIKIQGTDSKYTDTPLIIGSLFGGNSIYNDEAHEIDIEYTVGTSILSNYFFGVKNADTKSVIHLGKEAKSTIIKGSHWKLLNENTKKIMLLNIKTTQKKETVFQTKVRNKETNFPPNFSLENGGTLNWGGGFYDVDISLERLNNKLMSLSSGLQTNSIGVKTTSPKEIPDSNQYGTIFLDANDNKLKVKLPNGTIKTILFEK